MTRKSSNVGIKILVSLLFLLLSGQLYAAESRGHLLDQGLFLNIRPGTVGRFDPVIDRIISGKPIEAIAGEKVILSNGKSPVWKSEKADSDGWFKGDYLDGTYGYFQVNSPRERTVILESFGDEMVYVNGVPREGNKYGYKDDYPIWEAAYNYSQIPITLKKGRNEFLFLCSRGVLKVRLRDVQPGIFLNTADVTLPNFLAGRKIDDLAAVVVVNAARSPLEGAYLKATSSNGISCMSEVPLIQPMSVRKIGFEMKGPAPDSAGVSVVHLVVYSGAEKGARELASGDISIETVDSSSAHYVTFKSGIDGSVQHYAVVPPRGPENGKPKALFLSLHGADVIAMNMAKSYYPKTWGYIVCPTNGRPYGFDWEDWGRLDMLEVLRLAKSTLNIDPNRIYLTGHSMGGHGTMINGATYPDQFAAIGASAGWVSWWSYVFHHDTAASPVAGMLRRATMPLRTMQIRKNYSQLGVYLLHGSKDDNVPVRESITLADTLSKFDRDFVFHEQPGVGHWWSLNDEAGADCVDWAPMFDYFARHARPLDSRILNIDFTTASPGVSAEDYWVTVYQQNRQLDPSSVKVRFIPSRNKFEGTTENIRTLFFDLKIAETMKPLTVVLDADTLDSIVVQHNSEKLWMERSASGWHVASAPPANDKSPDRYGTLKDAFRHNVVFVYGTHGTGEENKWAFDKARFDAEYFWYQGNGSIEVVSDREFNPSSFAESNVILYGNEKTNSAWASVLGKTPVVLSEGQIRVGGETLEGKDYACFMVRPRPGSPTLSVGVIGGTGIEGMRLTYTVPYLQPGFELPDLTLLDKKSGNEGLFGIKAIGFFGLDWSVEHGDFAWR